jgi:hypothetical protein
MSMKPETPPAYHSGPFNHTDIGNPHLPGDVAKIDGGYDITAGGVDIWGTRDEFHYLYTRKDGDFDIRARVEALSKVDSYTKAGIMARECLAEGARHAYFQVFPDNAPRNNNNGGYEYQYRPIGGGEMKAIYPDAGRGIPSFTVNFPNAWLRLTRSGSVFTGYVSTNGDGWDTYAALELPLPHSLLLGIAVTSHNADKLTSASFRQITLLK